MKNLLISLSLIIIIGFYLYGRTIWISVYYKFVGKRTVEEVVNQYKTNVEQRLKPYFAKSSLAYPPKNLALLAFKQEKLLELWTDENGKKKFIISYKIQAASGHSGPKLREGDRQVPEGMYKISGLNPNSSYHLSMKLNYPNEYDLKYAQQEGRNEPGTNIFIHGDSASIGCLAMGDIVIEELFILVHEVGRKNVTVIISPYDFRNKAKQNIDGPVWLPELYSNIRLQLKGYVVK